MCFLNKFGNRLKELREAHSLSQEEFAENIGIQRNSYVRVEKGKGFVSPKTLERIVDFLEISYSELFKFDENSQADKYKVLKLKLKNMDDKDLEFIIAMLDAYVKAKRKFFK